MTGSKTSTTPTFRGVVEPSEGDDSSDAPPESQPVTPVADGESHGDTMWGNPSLPTHPEADNEGGDRVDDEWNRGQPRVSEGDRACNRQRDSEDHEGWGHGPPVGENPVLAKSRCLAHPVVVVLAGE